MSKDAEESGHCHPEIEEDGYVHCAIHHGHLLEELVNLQSKCVCDCSTLEGIPLSLPSCSCGM